MTSGAFQSTSEPSIERFLKAIRFDRTDRVPNWEIGIESRSVEYLIGKRQRYGALLPPDRAAVARQLGMDLITVPTPRNVDETKGLGEIWRRQEDGTEFYIDGTIKSGQDLARYDLDAIRQQWLRRAEGMIQESLEAARGTGLGVAGSLNGSFWVTQLTMGLVDFMMTLHDDPALVERIMDFWTGFDRELARLLVKAGVPLALVSDDLAHTSGPQVNPTWLEKQWLPRMRSVTEVLTGAGIPFVFHSCGKLDHVIPWLIQLGCSGVQAIQPNCNDIYAIRRQYGKQIALIGNIDITYPLSNGTPEDVGRDVVEHLERLAPQSGYVVSSSHSILNSIPPENFLAMVRTVQEWRPTF